MSESQQAQATFNIEKLYVKDLSLEVPNAPSIFLEQEGPTIDLEIQSAANGVGEGVFEVVLTVTVTAKREDKVYFLVQAAQAGIFRITGVPEDSLSPILGIACPNILFPYVRESVSDAVNRAGFPPVLLAPVNFEAIYQQRVEAERSKAGNGEIPIQ